MEKFTRKNKVCFFCKSTIDKTKETHFYINHQGKSALVCKDNCVSAMKECGKTCRVCFGNFIKSDENESVCWFCFIIENQPSAPPLREF